MPGPDPYMPLPQSSQATGGQDIPWGLGRGIFGISSKFAAQGACRYSIWSHERPNQNNLGQPGGMVPWRTAQTKTMQRIQNRNGHIFL